MVQHLVGRIQNGAEEIEFLAENLEGELLCFVIFRQKVDDRNLVLLAVPMTPADALLDALWIPRQIVIDERVAELEV